MEFAKTYLKTWTPAVSQRTPDRIVSSDYTKTKVFVPSYERELPRIEQLLTNDYQRIWWKEKHDWDVTFGERGAGKRILPRKLIKKKIPTCATVKYRIQTGRWKGKKQNSKSNLKKEKIKSNENLNTEESKSAKDDDSKLEKCDETKSEKHEETQSENGKERQKEREEKSCTD